MGHSKELSCEAGSFSQLLQPPQNFTFRSFQALFLHTGTLGCMVCLTPQLLLVIYLYTNVGPPTLPAAALPVPIYQLTHCYESSPLSFPSVPLLLVWFHTVQFFDSSGCFLFLNWLLSLFWLCKKAQCVYLHLHLGQK